MEEHGLPGTFIVVEGPDGSGTTTQAEKLAEELDAHYTAEPTSGKAGEKVQEMIKSGDYSAEAIALMFAADRLAHVEEEILPRLESGETVVCDRYYHSSLVYQPALGAGRDWVRQLNRQAPRPDLTVVLDVKAETGMERVEQRGSDDNIFENLDFQQKVVAMYRELPDRLEEPVRMVDSEQEVEKVFEDVLDAVSAETG